MQFMSKSLIIGCGNMGTAILKSILQANLFTEICIIDPSFESKKRVQLKEKEIGLEKYNNCSVKFFSNSINMLRGSFHIKSS